MQINNFNDYFNRDFWRGFKNQAFPITIPNTIEERRILVDKVANLISSGRYASNIPEVELIMNKGYGVARTVPAFCIEDYCVYYFCIKELENILCKNRTPNTFGGWTLGGQLRKEEESEIEIECDSTDYGRYSFNPRAWTRVFGEFNSLLFSQLESGRYSHVLQFDLSNFYDSVRLDMLERWIREESDSTKGEIITLLFYLLNHWNRKNTMMHPQSVGLPQDALADCSRILANYYLQKYDSFAENVCSQVGGIYFRYADDQMILLNDPGKIDGLLLLLTRNLDRYGLRVNQKKVDIWHTSELIEHRCRKIQSIFTEKDDNKNPVLVKEFVEEYLKIKKLHLQKMWNSGTPLLNRLLWANIKSLSPKLFNSIVERFITEEFILLSDHKKMSRIFYLNGKRKKPIDFIDHLKAISEKSVHNNYHYEAHAFAASIQNNDLKTHLENRIAFLNERIKTHEIY